MLFLKSLFQGRGGLQREGLSRFSVFFCFEKRFLRSASLLWFFKAGEDGRRGLGKAHQRIQSVKMEMNVGRMYSISTLKDCLVNKFFFVKKKGICKFNFKALEIQSKLVRNSF